MSLLPGLANHGGRRNTFVSPRLAEESLAHNSRAPSRRVGCASCDWMLKGSLGLPLRGCRLFVRRRPHRAASIGAAACCR